MRPPVLVAVVLSIAATSCSFPDYTVTTATDDSASSDDGDVLGPIDSSASDATRDGDATEVAVDGDATASDGETDTEAGSGCAPVMQRNFPLPAAYRLTCGSTTVLDVTLPAGTEGFAFARANLVITHAAIPKISYNWSARLEVGAPDSDQIAFPSGDDVCPSTTSSRVIGGFGRITPSSAHVRLSGLAAATLCAVGTLTIETSSSIDVWVEDPRPECAGKSIVVASYLKLVGPGAPVWDWPLLAAAAPVLTAKIETAATDTSLVAVAMIEGTATTNPNTTCGAEIGALTMHTTLDGTVLNTSQQKIPATTGAGRLLLDTFYQAPTTAGVHTVQLVAGRGFSTSKVSTGGSGGDAMLALIRKF